MNSRLLLIRSHRRRQALGIGSAIVVALLLLGFIAARSVRTASTARRPVKEEAEAFEPNVMRGGLDIQKIQTFVKSAIDEVEKRQLTENQHSGVVDAASGVVKPLNNTKTPTAVVHTDHGDITWALHPEDAPVTVANFARMAREGVFNNSCFYRYEKGFVLQGGLHCNKPPPHHGKAKTVPLEYKRRNEKYTVALARAGGDLNSGGTEFFINLRDNSNSLGPGKKGGYAVFATVVDGLDTIAALKALPTKTSGLTRFVSPQPTISFIEIRDYAAPQSQQQHDADAAATHPPKKKSKGKNAAHSGG